ncbi:MAG: hypothetical protein QG646_636 [Euryarchaeota archaeon]|nr:hypothetical protein [Euryarchaeota archaeon]
MDYENNRFCREACHECLIDNRILKNDRINQIQLLVFQTVRVKLKPPFLRTPDFPLAGEESKQLKKKFNCLYPGNYWKSRHLSKNIN